MGHHKLEISQIGVPRGGYLLIEAVGLVRMESASDCVREGVYGAGEGQVVVCEGGLTRVDKDVALVVSVGETAFRASSGAD